MDDREIIEDILEDFRDKVIECQDRNLSSRPYTDKTLEKLLSSLRSYYKQKLIERMSKEFTLDDFSLGKEYWKGFKDGNNQALTQFKQIVEEEMK